jgi:glycosyltransferase involved in cell wall biosynthesis
MKINNPSKGMKRILIGPAEVAGFYSALASGFASIGQACDLVTFSYHRFDYQAGSSSRRDTRLVLLIKSVSRLRARTENTFFAKVALAVLGETLQFLWGLWAIFHYQGFIFGFGRSLWPGNLDLWVLRKLGKPVLVNVGHGSDARPPYADGAYQSVNGSQQPSANFLSKRTALHSRRLEFFFRQAAYVIGSPYSTSPLAKDRFINFFELGFPVTSARIKGIETEPTGTQPAPETAPLVKVLHAPSHPAAKGTKVIAAAIENLKRKGLNLEFVLLEGVPNEKVLDEIQGCDFVVDQIYSDIPMSAFATEAAMLGKPSVVCGYDLKGLRRHISETMWPPALTSVPEDIEGAIETLAKDEHLRRMLGREAQRFVLESWKAENVAARYSKLLHRQPEELWWLDPLSVTYIYGACQPKSLTVKHMSELVRLYGASVLQIDHRPELLEACLSEIKR